MQICPSKLRIRQEIAQLRAAGKTIGLVPTMGFLHDGHVQLMRQAAQSADAVVATIFVNPTQFGPNEDLDRYPRNLDRDLALLRAEGVAAVFTPSPEEMYLPGADAIVDVPSLSGILQCAVRPGHFQGVATVVSKLFNITQPDVAVFGEKTINSWLSFEKWFAIWTSQYASWAIRRHGRPMVWPCHLAMSA